MTHQHGGKDHEKTKYAGPTIPVAALTNADGSPTDSNLYIMRHAKDGYNGGLVVGGTQDDINAAIAAADAHGGYTYTGSAPQTTLDAVSAFVAWEQGQHHSPKPPHAA